MSLTQSAIAKLIHANTSESSVDLQSICASFGIDIEFELETNDLANIKTIKGRPVINLNPSLTKKEKLTFVAIAVSEYILTPNRVNGKGITYDMFFMKDAYHQRFNNIMLLATRLALPENIISQLCKLETNVGEIIVKFDFTPEFLRCCVQDSNALFLLKNFSNQITLTA